MVLSPKLELRQPKARFSSYLKKKMLNKAETSLEVDFKTPLSLLSLLKFSKELLLFFVCCGLILTGRGIIFNGVAVVFKAVSSLVELETSQRARKCRSWAPAFPFFGRGEAEAAGEFAEE
jgi:hypothetical protein